MQNSKDGSLRTINPFSIIAIMATSDPKQQNVS